MTHTKPSDCYAKAHTDEPVFVLLGRDPNAPETVRFWAERRKIAIEDGQSTDSMTKVQDAYACADAMAAYQAHGTSALYRALGRCCSEAPANAISLHASLADRIARLLANAGSIRDYLSDLKAAASVLPTSWTLLNVRHNGPIWYATATRKGRELGETTGYGHTECAARTAMGLEARAYDLDYPT